MGPLHRLEGAVGELIRHDTVTPEIRSKTMAAVRASNTKPEMRVRRALHALGYRYRLHRRDLPGTPDLTFPARKAVVFVHGCFWHGHDCPRGARHPKTNAAYWRAKIARNRERDRRAAEALAAEGWRVFTLWECALKSPDWLDALQAFLADAGEATLRR